MTRPQGTALGVGVGGRLRRRVGLGVRMPGQQLGRHRAAQRGDGVRDVRRGAGRGRAGAGVGGRLGQQRGEERGRPLPGVDGQPGDRGEPLRRRPEQRPGQHQLRDPEGAVEVDPVRPGRVGDDQPPRMQRAPVAVLHGRAAAVEHQDDVVRVGVLAGDVGRRAVEVVRGRLDAGEVDGTDGPVPQAALEAVVGAPADGFQLGGEEGVADEGAPGVEVGDGVVTGRAESVQHGSSYRRLPEDPRQGGPGGWDDRGGSAGKGMGGAREGRVRPSLDAPAPVRKPPLCVSPICVATPARAW
ncbi:hypothetical protein QI554_42130 [Yinghuangia seranimata]|nr:hypothetical protein [Yinghuangia seranimata]MDI2132749.1 hypothetical protein [Yinghuangia seranimata]